jgi:hypothetical protein
MSVRAKFVVNKISRTLMGSDEGQTISLTPVYANSPENAEFYKWTPCGSVELGTINPKAGDYFKLGKEYFLDFTAVENKQ